MRTRYVDIHDETDVRWTLGYWYTRPFHSTRFEPAGGGVEVQDWHREGEPVDVDQVPQWIQGELIDAAYEAERQEETAWA